MVILMIKVFITVLCVIILLKQLLKKWEYQATKIPGLQPASKEDGNLGDIAKAGSLHEFLVDLHKQFGPIASFWLGPTFMVSIAETRYFKEHLGVFDRPPVLFKLFEPLIGPKSIQYANGADGHARRHPYDKVLTHAAVRKYFGIFQEISDELAKKWETLLNKEHIPLCQNMTTLALKAVLTSLFGEKLMDKTVHKFRIAYDIVWNEMESRLTEPITQEGEETFQKGMNELMVVCKEIVQNRKKIPFEHAEEYLLDLILDLTEDEEQQFSDTLTFIIGGFHTIGNFLACIFYFLATHSAVQEKVYKEIKDVLGDESVDHTNIGDLHYMRQVQNETMRCAVLAPIAARFQDFDSMLGGHKIPKNTPVVHALGVASVDDKVWPMPNKFDPDRFSPENSSSRPHLAFVPFGFAGKRICPGQRFAYAEATVAMVTLLKKFEVQMVDGQVIDRVYGLVTHPSDEIWITLSKR